MLENKLIRLGGWGGGGRGEIMSEKLDEKVSNAMSGPA